MFKNVASQTITFLVIDTVTNLPKTGDAANLTAYVKIDNGAVTVLTDTSAAELDATNAPGLYDFGLTQAETNGDKLVFSGKSSTAGVRVVPMPVYTFPETGILAPTTAGRTLLLDGSGRIDLGLWLGSTPLILNAQRVNVDAQAIAGNTLAASNVATVYSSVPPSDSAGVGTLLTRLDATRAVNLDNLNIGGAVASQASVNTIDDLLDTEMAATLAAVDTEIGAIQTTLSSLVTTVGVAGAGLTAITGATLSSAYDFAKGTAAMTEAYRAAGVAPTPVQAFFEIIAHLGDSAIVSTTKTLYCSGICTTCSYIAYTYPNGKPLRSDYALYSCVHLYCLILFAACGLLVVVVLAQALPVVAVPEQRLISSMRHDMVNHCCCSNPVFLATGHA